MKNKIGNISLDFGLSSPKYFSTSSRTYQAKKLNSSRQDTTPLGHSQLLQQFRGNSESPSIRKSTDMNTPRNIRAKLILPTVDRSSPVNNSVVKTPSRFSVMISRSKKEEEKKTEESVLSDAESFVLRQYKVSSGKEIIRRSNDLISSVRSPKDIYQEAFEQKSYKDENNTNRYGKANLRKLAKRFDVTLNLHEPGKLPLLIREN